MPDLNAYATIEAPLQRVLAGLDVRQDVPGDVATQHLQPRDYISSSWMQSGGSQVLCARRIIGAGIPWIPGLGHSASRSVSSTISAPTTIPTATPVVTTAIMTTAVMAAAVATGIVTTGAMNGTILLPLTVKGGLGITWEPATVGTG